MKWTLPLAAFLILGVPDARAERAQSPADATVFIRLVGSVHAEFEEVGTARQSVDIDRVEIGTGSGFVISPHGYVLTNEHVISNTEINVNEPLRKARITLKVAKVEVCFPESTSSARGGGPRCFDASVHSADANRDLAVLFIGASDLPYVALGDSDVIRNGQGVSALGYPFGRALEVGRVSAPDLVPEVSTSKGSISALRADDNGVRSALQVNGIVNPGNSGGPVVDERGYAVGVVRARVKGDAGIAFAIPINQAKDFLESRGLDSLMPSRRLRLGPVQVLERKGFALRLPEGVEGVVDASPFRSRVESAPGLTDIAFRIDRAVSPWTAAQLERTLLQTGTLERLLFAEHQSQSVSRTAGSRLLAGRAAAMDPDSDSEIAMHYGILDLGDEKLIARYVGSPELFAYNESVLRGSILSLDAQLLMTGELVSAEVEWGRGPWSMPVGWIVEPAAPSACAALPRFSGVLTAYPAGDVTVALRRATWDDAAVSTQAAAASCSSRRGSQGDSSYTLRVDWLGVSYAIEGVFVRLGSRLVQLEVIAPDRKTPVARALLAAWIKENSGGQQMTRLFAVTLVVVLSGWVIGCNAPSNRGPVLEAPGRDADPRADDAQNVRLVGYNDLQGRESLVVTTLSDPANGSWVYVGHHESFWDGKPKMNPITGKEEWNGTSILNVDDPAKPKLVWHIPNESNRNSRGVSVVYDYKFDGSGRDYLIRNSEVLTEGETGKDLKYQIFDITTRGSEPSKISLVSEITGTPPNSCGPGCGGAFIMRAHKGWWSQDTGYFYAASGEPGFRNVVIQIFDLKNPREPKFIGRAWLPSQKEGEPGYEGQYAHHPVVDEVNKRLYVAYRNSGWTAEFDIADPAKPKLIWSLDMNPPHRGPHTVSPIVYDKVPNFGASALPRKYAFVVDEAAGAADMAPCTNGVRAGSYMLDITNETRPFPVSVWQVPVGNFCSKGGRFGPHQSAETVNGRLNRFEDKIAWLAYFNAGIRVVDLSDPYHLKELGYYVPKTNERSHPMDKEQPVAIQINDVDIDHRGLAYASDRAGTGLFILEYTRHTP